MSKYNKNHLDWCASKGSLPDVLYTIEECNDSDWLLDLIEAEQKDRGRKAVLSASKARIEKIGQARLNQPITALPDPLRERASWLINAGDDDTKRGLAAMVDPGTEDDLAVLRAAIAVESARPVPRVSRLKPMKAKLARLGNMTNTDARITAANLAARNPNPNPPAKRVKNFAAMIEDYEQAAAKEYGLDQPSPLETENLKLETLEAEIVTGPETLLTGESRSLSPVAAAALAAVASGWQEARRLADLAKNYARASTAAKALCGLKLRAIREYYFGPRDPRGGRPKMKVANPSGQTWDGMLADKAGVSPSTADVWMKMADAVETMADREGLGLRAMLEKLPWDWTPEESAMIEATVNRLTENQTQRQLLQADFLTDLGFIAPERLNGSNNPHGKNGSGQPREILSPEETIQVRREGARVEVYGTKQIGRMEPGSHGWWLVHTVQSQGEHLEALPAVELKAFYEDIVQPFAALIKSLTHRK